MVLKLSQKQVVSLLVIGFLLTLGSGTLTFIFNHPYDLYIRLTDVIWPPERFLQGETILGEIYVSYAVDLTFEIWNPSKKTLVYTTPNSNLLDPQMEIRLEEDYYISSGYSFGIFISTHEIKPGITYRIGAIGIYVEGYNATIPPAGTYTIMTGIVDSISGEPPSIISYQTVIHHEYNESIIDYEQTPEKWGEINPFYRKIAPIILWALSGGEIAVIVYIYLRKRKKKIPTKL